MRLAFTSLVALVLSSSVAFAVDLPVSAVYGTESGCAKAVEARELPPGTVMAVMPHEIFQGSLMCTFKSVTQTATDPAAPAWQVQAACSEGHEDDVKNVTYTITERIADKMVVAEVTSGNGLPGEYAYCPVQPAP